MDHRHWRHLPPSGIAAIFHDAPFPWWIAGGYAIDQLAGCGRRPHGDIDIGLFHGDHAAARQFLVAWELHAADPPGTLRAWLPGEALAPTVHDAWARHHASDPWRFQLMFNPGAGDTLVYRRDPRISWPLADALHYVDGVPYLAPEIQLLFKSNAPRPKDTRDFLDCLPLLDPRARETLATALRLTTPAHPWLAQLRR